MFKKKISSLICILLCALNAHLQTNQTFNVDSLKRVTFDENVPDTCQIDAYYHLALYYYYQNPDSSEYFVQRALKKSEQILFGDGLGQGYGWMVLFNTNRGDYLNAIDYQLKALKFLQFLGSDEDYSIGLNNFGKLHIDLENYDEAITYFDQAIELNAKFERMEGLATNYNNKGISYKSMGDYEKALEMFKKSLAIRLTQQDTLKLAISYGNLGTLYELMDSLDLAYSYYEKNLEYSKLKNSKRSLSLAYQRMGGVILKTGGNPQTAIDYGRKGYAMATKFHYAYEAKQNAKLLTKAYKQIGNYKNAFEYIEIYNQLNDSINNSNNQRAIIKSKYQLEYNQKKIVDSLENARIELANKLLYQENKLKESKISNQRLWLIFSALALVFLIVLLIVFQRNAKARMEKLRAEIRLRLSEVVALKNELAEEKEVATSKKQQLDLNIVLHDQLTLREQEVLDQLILGMSNKAIGEKLFLSVNTIKTHILSIYNKLDVNNRTQAAIKGSMLQQKIKNN